MGEGELHLAYVGGELNSLRFRIRLVACTVKLRSACLYVWPMPSAVDGPDPLLRYLTSVERIKRPKDREDHRQCGTVRV